MTAAQERDPDLLRDLRAPSAEHDGVFWRNGGQLVVFDADAAVAANADNYADLTMPDRLVDVLRRRPSTPVSWKQVRAAYLSRMRRLCAADELAALDERMAAVLRERLDQPVDLMWLAHEVSFRSIVPSVIGGLGPRDRSRITRDALVKLNRLLRTLKRDRPLWMQPRLMAVGASAGLVIRRELRRRAAGRVPPRLDLIDVIATELLDDLGMDRAVHAVAAVLTAIAGPPGAAAANLMYALVTRPEWAQRLTAEFAGVGTDELYGSGTRCAPVAHRFVKEVLRTWTAPTMMTRSARTRLNIRGHDLDIGQHFVVSPAMVHHDPRHWRDPEVFDPDRWLPDSPRGLTGGQHYVPFGWAPIGCIGASLGTIQLVLLCRQLCTAFRLEPATPDRLRMAVGGVAMPLDFTGAVRAREPRVD
ncbi:cytochrome P450 [Virgisporangium aliadipatigenens]|uniref:Cytochrome P450 n=1 Tax=Virgisporangium aliadipatigenens TaxID=741659 RepID=A0A8J3YSG7_9ACTN|nr:cytochrome P450 [Virgisporangium aliadipatigenens]GIJ49657.1 cytochrome P450 [Virgisporangium aliadipatigenens]